MSDYDELIIDLFGLSENADFNQIEQVIYEKYDCSYETFISIAGDLMKYTIPAKAELSGKYYQGFVKDGAFLVKQRATL